MNSGKHGNKWVHWYQMGYVSSKYASLHFIIQRQFSLFSFSSKKDIFFHSGHHPYRRYCHIVKKKYWLCLFSKMLNRIFVLLEMLYQYLATVIIRGVIRTLLNMMKFFVKIGYSFYFHHWCLTRFSLCVKCVQMRTRKTPYLNTFHTVFEFPLIMILPFKICFFSWELQLKKNTSYEFTLLYMSLLIPSKNLGNAK